MVSWIGKLEVHLGNHLCCCHCTAQIRVGGVKCPVGQLLRDGRRQFPYMDCSRSGDLNLQPSFCSLPSYPLAHCVISIVKSGIRFADLYIVELGQLHHIGLNLFLSVWEGETVHIVLVAKVGLPKIHNCTASFKQLKITECSCLVWYNCSV